MAQTVIYRIEVDPNLIPDGEVASLLQALDDFQPVIEDFGRQISAAEKGNFASQGAGFGLPWPALSPLTLAEKQRKGYPSTSLVRTGALQAAVGESVMLTPTSVQVGVDLSAVPYAAYHQTGTSRMPARVLVAVSDDMIDEMMQTLRAYLANATGGDLTGISIVAETA
jgi:phage gpG-like protein